MKHLLQATLLTTALTLAGSSVARAHAFLDHAVPGVGAEVTGAPRELELSFSEGIVPALSGVKIASASGAPVATGKPVGAPHSPSVLLVRLDRPLAAGSYVVTWHVVSTDTHRTSGSYHFTVSP